MNPIKRHAFFLSTPDGKTIIVEDKCGSKQESKRFLFQDKAISGVLDWINRRQGRSILAFDCMISGLDRLGIDSGSFKEEILTAVARLGGRLIFGKFGEDLYWLMPVQTKSFRIYHGTITQTWNLRKISEDDAYNLCVRLGSLAVTCFEARHRRETSVPPVTETSGPPVTKGSIGATRHK